MGKAVYVVTRILCPYSQNGRVYPSGLLEKKVNEFIGVPIVLGHGSNNKIGEILEAVYDSESRCILAKVYIDESKLDSSLISALKEKKVAFSIEGEALKVSEIQGEIVVQDFAIKKVALVAEPGVNGARPIAVSDSDIALLEALRTGTEPTITGSEVVMTEKQPLVNGAEPIEEEASGYAGPVTAPVNVNVNLNIVGGESTGDGKVQSQKGSERQEMGEEDSNGSSGSKFQLQRGAQYKQMTSNEEELEEECIDEACKKRKKKSKEELDEDECIDEACKKKRKETNKEELGEDEECIDEACKKRKKKMKEEEAVERFERGKAVAEALLKLEIKETLEEVTGEEIDVDDIDEEDLDELISYLGLDEASRKKCDDSCIEKCKKLSKKYGIPCILDKLGYTAHPECIGNSKCCDPVNGFWPIDKPGRAKIAMYLMTRHWTKMANRYGLKGWAKIVDCIVTKAKGFGVNVKCDTLKQRTPNIWKFLTNAKKACVSEEYDMGNVMRESKVETISESLFAAKDEGIDLDTAFLKLTESLASGVPIREDLSHAFDILQPIVTKVSEYTREGKLWGKLGNKVALNRKNLVVGATVEIPYIDERSVEASIATTDGTAPGTIDVSLTTTTPVTVKLAQGKFAWTDDQARLLRNIGSIATNVLSQAIVNVLDKEVAKTLETNGQAYNYNPNDVTTVPAPNVADIWNAMTDLVADGWKPKVAVMHPKVITELAKQDDTVKQALVYKKTLQPGDVIPMLGINVIVGDNYATPIKALDDGNHQVTATFVYVLDDSSVIGVEDPNVELASAYYPEQAKPYVLVARKRYGIGVVRPDAIKKLAFKME